MNKNLLNAFDLNVEDTKRMDALVRQTGLAGAHGGAELMGRAMAEPIRQVAPYLSWTERFFVADPIAPAQDNRIPIDEYTAVAFYSSPTGQIMYTRPGRKYVRPDFTQIDCGLEIGWDTMAEAGWNILARKQLEAAEELARKRDALALPVITAAVTASGNLTNSAAAGFMDKAAVDTIFQTMAGRGWKITQVIGNPADLMDMTNWTLASALWQWPEGMTRTLLTEFFWSGYGNAMWYAYPSAPTSSVYFTIAPAQIGYHQTKGDIRTATDIDIDKGVNKYRWDEKDAYWIGNNYGLWRLTIT